MTIDETNTSPEGRDEPDPAVDARSEESSGGRRRNAAAADERLEGSSGGRQRNAATADARSEESSGGRRRNTAAAEERSEGSSGGRQRNAATADARSENAPQSEHGTGGEPALLHRLEQALGKDVRRDVVLAPYTTFRIGGPADLFFEARTVDELVRAIMLARESGVDYFLLGRGANILVGDGGFRGLVIHSAAREIRVHDDRVWAESGAIMYPDVIHTAVNCGLSGLEHYVGIPSTVGGALWQNLHFLSPGRERTMFIEEVLAEAEILTEEGERRHVDVHYFDFGYDYSILHVRSDVVLSATFQLEPGDERRMREIMEANLQWRRERHAPLDTEPSAGSIFKKIDGIGAGRLIDQCGLKGFRVGGAEVTRRHANIMINRSEATAADVRALIAYVQTVVERETGHRLEPEISFVGAFDPETEVKSDA